MSLPLPDKLKYDAPSPGAAADPPDVLAIAKARGRKLFPHAPNQIQITGAFRPPGSTTLKVCARVVDDSRQPTMLVGISSGQFVDRWRAQPEDGCDSKDYTLVDVD